VLALAALLGAPGGAIADACGRSASLAVQVLGSGGPEFQPERAATGYVLWLDGAARLLVDAGGGVALRFADAGARFADLDAVLLTHLHVDHAADVAVFAKSGWFTERTRDLPVYGPSGNDFMPGTERWLERLLGDNGAFRYLADQLAPAGEAVWRFIPHTLPADERHSPSPAAFAHRGGSIAALPVHHGPIAALAYRIEARGRRVVFTGDTSALRGGEDALAAFADGADLLVAHHAVPEGVSGAARRLHMPPSVIGRIAGSAGVRRLVLSHRMRRTLGREDESLAAIRERYAGPVAFADDFDCLALAD
jgi:ribonuclease BN (tRNA processing enzyme)